MHPQRSFAFAPSTQARFDNFESGANGELLTRLQQLEVGRFSGLWLYGPAGRGKSHLLQAAAQHAWQRASADIAADVAYLPLARVSDPVALEGLEARALVLLDDLDHWLGSEAHERALMALYTGLFERAATLIVASAAGPGTLVTALPDLASRLRAMARFEVLPIDEDARQRVLEARAALRGVALRESALSYWLRRGPRDLKRLLEDLELLLDDALGEHSPVTVNTVKRVLDL
ncbi:MAG: hypothetical protein AAGI15_03085 [Pseudomonadota bacterium]